MITPKFECSQTDATVIVRVYCPSIRAAEVEIHVDETLFTLYINPYFLRLNFPGAVLEDDDSSANYDASAGYLTITLTKETKGQDFKDLDLLSKLLAPKSLVDGPAPTPIIEVLHSEVTTNAEADADELSGHMAKLTTVEHELLQAAQNDWQLTQTVPEPESLLHTSLNKPYGFLNLHSGYFKHVGHTENEVNELGADAETCSPSERRIRRLNHEEEKWDQEYYMADYADDDYIQELISWQHAQVSTFGDFEYLEQEKLTMLRLPRKEYLATPAQAFGIYLTLVQLLFSYAYETRTTQCDPTPESAWTLCSLTPAFSALDPPPYDHHDLSPVDVPSLESTLVASYRRSLAFPLYRSWALSETCQADVAMIMIAGKRLVLRCLMQTKDILDHHEVYYIYSKLWVDDFCAWVQSNASDDSLAKIGRALQQMKLAKSSLGWDLEDLEAATRLNEVRQSDSDDESDEG